jgi:hypothetical protein
MEDRRLLRPLPLILIFVFVAVAVADLVQKLTEVPPPPPEIAGVAIPRFDALEPVIDFRLQDGDPEVEIRPIPELVQGQWSAPKSHGVWARGAVAELRLELAAGGHRVLILECQPTSGKRPVGSLHVTVNGLDLGVVDLIPGWHRYRLALPEGAVRPGSNRVALRFPDRAPAERPRRALLIRKLGWFLDDDVDTEVLDDARPVSLDLDAERVNIRRSGILKIPVILDDRTDALQMRYRFPSGSGRAEVAVKQSEDGGVGLDDAMRATMSAEEQNTGRIRVPLHGRRGAFMVHIWADLDPSGSQLLISSLRLVEEGDPTRRPWAASSPQN